MLDPTENYETPEELLADPELGRDEKIDLLHRWEYHERQLEVATEEGMPGNGTGVLPRVLAALAELGAGPAHGPAPTKLG